MCPDQPSGKSARRPAGGPEDRSLSLAEAEAWLDGLINRERQARPAYSRFGLDAIEALLSRLGNPERELSIVHLAGSKGKGSTALLIEAVLCSLERVGTFTSPTCCAGRSVSAWMGRRSPARRWSGRSRRFVHT